MRLSVLLMFLLALTRSSGLRCGNPWINQESYNEFSKRHILSMNLKYENELKDFFEKHLIDHNLCGRVDLQTFFRQSNSDRAKNSVLIVDNICNGNGFEYGNDGNLCISQQKFPVYKVESKLKGKSGCKIQKVTPEDAYVIVGCGKVKNLCLPVHFHNQTIEAPNQNGAVCKP